MSRQYATKAAVSSNPVVHDSKSNSAIRALPPVKVEGKFLVAGGEKLFLQGASYGPFAPREDVTNLPLPEVVACDLNDMCEAGVNLVRVYYVPPTWFLDACQSAGLRVLITIPWAQHIEFLDNREIQQSVIDTILSGVREHVGHAAVLGYLVGNEVPSQMVRWIGQRRVRKFLERLISLAREVNPDVLFSYATYPTTEYLIPGNVDFCTFNVYLHDQDAFVRYIARLQNLADTKPLLIGEFGMDSQRHPEEEQAELLGWHIETVVRGGLAGTIVFSWTDEWFTGGQEITDWSFGIVRRDRSRKPVFDVVKRAFAGPGTISERIGLEAYPKVSVIVCSYNGGATLEACLESLQHLRYPNYEVVFVDDGSTDATPQIIQNFPTVRAVCQTNHGLSHARNVGAATATGEIFAYTDSDCMADPDWLYYLVATLQTGDYGGVGGPNLPPPADNSVKACVAAAPGGPTHVLLTDVVAEHIPGCNMAFHRAAFEMVGGFDERYRKAGDDVDFCWRLQQAGEVIAFSPSALVWHHRRFSPTAYLHQQWGYGEAESMLRFKHLAFFSATGNARWKGRVYGQRSFRWLPGRELVYHGVLGTGLFQTIYPAAESELASYFRSLEWVILAVVLALVSIPVEALRLLPVLMLGGTGLVALNYMLGAKIDPKFDGFKGRLLVGWLSLVQPLARGWARYLTWLRVKRTPARVLHDTSHRRSQRVRREAGSLILWSENCICREQLLTEVFATLEKEGWSYSADTGWNAWDVKIYGNLWWSVVMKTVTEYHGGPRCLTRVQLSLQPVATVVFLLIGGIGLVSWLACAQPAYTAIGGVALAGIIASMAWRAHRLKARLRDVLEVAGEICGMDEIPTSVGK